MSEHVYRLVELVGSSTVGSDDAVRNAMGFRLES
jgi:flavin-binding protein dodecin